MNLFSPSNLSALQTMLDSNNPNADSTNGNATPVPFQSQPSLAAPFAKIEPTLNTRHLSTGASRVENEIWSGSEIKNIKPEFFTDDRATPDHEVR